MAIAKIQVLAGLTRDEKQARLGAVHQALVGALQVPVDDPVVQLIELDPDNVILPGGASNDLTIVEITMFEGRSLGAKRTLYELIARSHEGLGIAPADLVMVIHEPAMHNWGVRGGVPASEVDLGFRVDV